MPLLAGMPHVVNWKKLNCSKLEPLAGSRHLWRMTGHVLLNWIYCQFRYLSKFWLCYFGKMCNSCFHYDFSGVFSIKLAPRRENRLILMCLKKPRTEVMHQDFFVKCRLISHISSIDVTKPLGMKAQTLRFFWSFFESKYSENNVKTTPAMVLANWLILLHCFKIL